ncbi:MAG: class I SAM-dependent RNA methyltransferase [Clostridia bacterium]|nr:class I SAM-dependent RNA methyltransferase [Clostridia bacterium]
MHMNFLVPCLMGVESLIAAELRELGAEDVRAENARVLFSGDEHLLVRANLCLRYAERIQIVLGTFHAETFEELFQGVLSLPLEDWIGKEDAFPVKGYSLNSKLFSVRDCQAIIKKAAVERLKQKYKVPWFSETGITYQLQFSILKDEVTLVIDSTGTGLHKRGYRLQANEAPIKETLAASLCSLARLRPYHTLYDPMCGSGTILIEGALMACHIAPGIRRTFAAESFGQIPKTVWSEERERALDLVDRSCEFHAYGSDIDPDSIAIARENARRAGVEDRIDFSVRDIRDFEKQSDRGTVICNPPYGERLMEVQEAEALYREMGRLFRPERGWAYNVISPSEEFETLFGRKADKRRKLYNGMIKCQYYMYFKAPKSPKGDRP